MARILILDDDSDVLEMYAYIQKISGFESVTASSTVEAYILLSRFRPQVCVVDLMLPGEDGVSFVEASKPLYPQTSFIAVSGALYNWTEEELATAGFDAFLPKPVDVNLLRTKIIDGIRRHNCPCTENLCLPLELSCISREHKIEKKCSMCGEVWSTLADFHNDPQVYPLGLLRFSDQNRCALQFNHAKPGCGSTGAIMLPAHYAQALEKSLPPDNALQSKHSEFATAAHAAYQ